MNSYKAQSGLLTDQAYKRGGTGVAERLYTYNALGIPTTRRTARQGTVRNDVFGYNERSELTSAELGTAPYAYDYDNIGNRKTAQEDAEFITYEANELNQYTDITTGEESFIPEYDLDGNQTRIRTSTGIWTADYNAQNRPIRFTRENTDGTRTVITAAYDYMGRRAWKKVETIATDPETGEETAMVTLHQRYIYRGYLQVAACDLTRGSHPCLWLITWDPTQPIATRPLAIQKDGTWYCYGWDLTKNICEVFGQAGYIRTTYAYTPYGSVTEEGDVTQPLQWSSEYADPELGLVYYNYRSYNPTDGRWTSRDILGEVASILLYAYAGNMVEGVRDILGLIIQRQPSLGKLIFEPIPGGQEPECQACAKRMHEMQAAMYSHFKPIPGIICRVQVKCEYPEDRYRHASALTRPVPQPPPKSHKSDIERVVMITMGCNPCKYKTYTIRGVKNDISFMKAFLHEAQHAYDWCMDPSRYTHTRTEVHAYARFNVERPPTVPDSVYKAVLKAAVQQSTKIGKTDYFVPQEFEEEYDKLFSNPIR